MIRDTVKASDDGIEKLQKAYKDLKFRNWEEVAEQTGVHIDTIKRLRGAKDVKNGERASVERSAVEKIAKILNLQPSDIVDNWYPVTIPTEFQTVIDDKTKLFCGRKFVFNAINQFIENHKSGYFTILGDAGMGKSAIAAKYRLIL
jgi:DNA-binding Xre family transcriptional regulator